MLLVKVESVKTIPRSTFVLEKSNLKNKNKSNLFFWLLVKTIPRSTFVGSRKSRSKKKKFWL